MKIEEMIFANRADCSGCEACANRQCQIFCVFELLDGVVARFLSAITQNL